MGAELRIDAATEPQQLPSSPASVVMQHGEVVVKTHRAETVAHDLDARLQLIGRAPLRQVFVQPLHAKSRLVNSRVVTMWPAGVATVAPTPAAVDWESAAALLAALHNAPLLGLTNHNLIPTASWLPRLARTRARLLAADDTVSKRVVLAAFGTLPAFEWKKWSSRIRCIVHGDWHPGQVVEFRGKARLIDVDDVGFGDPAWDLARPAAWHLAGLLSNAEWDRFLGSYCEQLFQTIDRVSPWTTLELPARAAVIRDAANAILRSAREERALEDYEEELVNTCSRIIRTCS